MKIKFFWFIILLSDIILYSDGFLEVQQGVWI